MLPLTASPALNVLVGATELTVAAFILLEGRRLGADRHSQLWILSAFFVLDGLVALNRSEVFWSLTPSLIRATLLDAVAAMILVPVLLNARGMARTLLDSIDIARVQAAEYRRARRDYAQLVRHRMMNPLAVIHGAALTLQSPSIGDEATRQSLLQAILEASAELQEMTLEPERRDETESDLDALPRLHA